MNKPFYLCVPFKAGNICNDPKPRQAETYADAVEKAKSMLGNGVAITDVIIMCSLTSVHRSDPPVNVKQLPMPADLPDVNVSKFDQEELRRSRFRDSPEGEADDNHGVPAEAAFGSRVLTNGAPEEAHHSALGTGRSVGADRNLSDRLRHA